MINKNTIFLIGISLSLVLSCAVGLYSFPKGTSIQISNFCITFVVSLIITNIATSLIWYKSKNVSDGEKVK